MNDDITGWNDWAEAFANWTDVSVSELHGIMTALMTVCDAPDSKVWEAVLSELSFTKLDDSALQLLTEEAEDVSFQLKDKDDAYGYLPLVPDDEHELYERVLALKNWASGFITGVGVADYSLSDSESESIGDLARIAAIRITPEDEFDGGEESYLHLYEFARFVPVSLATRKRKTVSSLPLLAGLPMGVKTANELAQDKQNAEETNAEETIEENQLPTVFDVMGRPS